MSNSRLIPTEKIIERLQYENPWWLTKEIPLLYKEMSKRLYFDLFYPFVMETDVRRAVVLMGPRRVGKTVMMFHTIDQLPIDRDYALSMVDAFMVGYVIQLAVEVDCTSSN